MTCLSDDNQYRNDGHSPWSATIGSGWVLSKGKGCQGEATDESMARSMAPGSSISLSGRCPSNESQLRLKLCRDLFAFGLLVLVSKLRIHRRMRPIEF
jgi:hypothetical protein